MATPDTHCHLGVSCRLSDADTLAAKLDACEARQFHLMSTNQWDVAIVDAIAGATDSVVPYYGVHPWYSHLFALDASLSKEQHYQSVLSGFSAELLPFLPDPIPLDEHLRHIEGLAGKQGKPFGIGEIGLDKLFRIPSNGYYGNPASRDVKLTNARVKMEHQVEVFRRQLDLANTLRKPVSLHCVKAHGPFFDMVCPNFLDISAVILHSYTGLVDQAQRWIRENKGQRKLLFSFSNYINASEDKLPALQGVVRALDDSQVLAESDMPLDRYFLHDKQKEYYDHLTNIVSELAAARGWTTGECERIVAANAAELHSCT